MASQQDEGEHVEPLVSVVVPTRNRCQLLAQTLASVLAQRLPVEVVVVDEGSTDGTSDWLHSLKDPRIRVTHHENPKGLSAARNAGIAASTCDWIAFVDDDDIWSPSKLVTQLEACKEAGAQWCYTAAVHFRVLASGAPQPLLLHPARPPGQAVAQLPSSNCVPGGGSGVLVHRDLIDKVGVFDPELPAVGDWDYWIRLSLYGMPAAVSTPLVAYRHHADNMSGSVRRMLSGARLVEQRYASLRGEAPLDWERQYRWLIRAAWYRGDRSAAVQVTSRALRAGAPRSLSWLVRSLVPPLTPRPPADSAAELEWLDRVLRRRGVLPWPKGFLEWLTTFLAEPGRTLPKASR